MTSSSVLSFCQGPSSRAHGAMYHVAYKLLIMLIKFHVCEHSLWPCCISTLRSRYYAVYLIACSPKPCSDNTRNRHILHKFLCAFPIPVMHVCTCRMMDLTDSWPVSYKQRITRINHFKCHLRVSSCVELAVRVAQTCAVCTVMC
jgi:hypothetical protein